MKDSKYGKYLPVGTVVLLKKGKKKAVITGFCTADRKNLDKIYDYCGCLYPEGIVSSDVTLLFDHNQIDKIYHLGYRDKEEIEFKKKLNEVAEKLKSDKK